MSDGLRSDAAAWAQYVIEGMAKRVDEMYGSSPPSCRSSRASSSGPSARPSRRSCWRLGRGRTSKGQSSASASTRSSGCGGEPFRTFGSGSRTPGSSSRPTWPSSPPRCRPRSATGWSAADGPARPGQGGDRAGRKGARRHREGGRLGTGQAGAGPAPPGGRPPALTRCPPGGRGGEGGIRTPEEP
jgi:hypothetical protein